MTKRKRYSGDFKAKVAIEATREEFTLSELSKKYDVHPNTISIWKRAVSENMAMAFSNGKETESQTSSAEIEKLYAKIGQLVAERFFFASLCSAGREWRQKAVMRDHPKLSIRRECKLLSLSRSGLYYQPVGESAGNLRFMEIIDKLFLKTPWYVSRKMARYMKRQVHKCGRHRVRRLIRLMRLVPIFREPNASKKHPAHKIWPYLLKDLSIERPNQVWCVDITYVPMRRGFPTAWKRVFCVDALREALSRYGRLVTRQRHEAFA